MGEALTVEGRFRGPAGVGNGGYVAGRMALLLGDGRGPAEVTLRRGWPPDAPLLIRRHPDRVEALDAAGTPIAEVREAALDLSPPTRAEAEAAARWFLDRPFTHSIGLCFVCGAARPEGDGLRVFTGRVEDRPGLAAAVWRPDPAFADPTTGQVRPEFLWAALDCAGSSAFTVGTGEPGRMLLGRIAARLDGPVAAGEDCIVMGWQIGRDGRKLTAGTALFGAASDLLRGVARALWVAPLVAA